VNRCIVHRGDREARGVPSREFSGVVNARHRWTTVVASQRGDRETSSKRDIVCYELNARRHWAKRRGSKVLPGPVRLDPASSARWFRGWRSGSVGAEEAARAADAPAVRAPRTWLLAVGWRRLGLLDPAEVPG